MQFLNRIITRRFPSSSSSSYCNLPKYLNLLSISNPRVFSTDESTGSGGGDFGWDDDSTSWSTGLTKDHFDGEAVGHQVTPPPSSETTGGGYGGGGIVKASETVAFGGSTVAASESRLRQQLAEMERELRRGDKEVDGWEEREREISQLLKQIEEPGARGSYLKDSEKAEMYKKHKENPEVYTVEKLAAENRIMRQRVLAILWLKELEEEEEKKRGEPLDDSVELLLDTFPEFFNYHDREFHVASLPYKPDFKVMPEGWDGTTRDPDEVHYEISKKEDDMLYEEFVQRFHFNKMKFNKQVKVHKYSRRRPTNGWDFIVEVKGPRGKRGTGGGWKFASQPDGSTRPLNKIEKMYAKRETPRRRRRILP
ncbi:hypothetical protein RND81_12G030500 [Saponaria officinalis]|uniref:Uncharacterized protein n=1 Tax=Saponaria officinalis TaxID=3572 RepID=A0AAW1H2S0_SAPOF